MSLPPIEQVAAAPEGGGLVAILLLAVLQGLAEFLPISSSGHLVVTRVMLGVKEAGLALDVALHVGTLFAVLWAYRRDVGKLFVQVLDRDFRLLIWLVVATIPVGIAGMTAKDWIESVFHTTDAVAGALYGTATLLLIGEWARARNEHRHPETESALGQEVELAPRFSDAVFIGVAQVLALIPGVSRSGTTISAGMLRGLSPTQAARLSFLMSLPAVAGAAIVELPHAIEAGFGEYSRLEVFGAAALAGLVGWAALRTLLVVLRKGAFRWFAAYCAVLATVLLVFA